MSGFWKRPPPRKYPGTEAVSFSSLIDKRIYASDVAALFLILALIYFGWWKLLLCILIFPIAKIALFFYLEYTL